MDKSFGATTALRQVDLDVYSGEIHGLGGENGSGKSTLTSIIAGIQKADAGEIRFHGKLWQPASMIDALEHGIGMIVQETGTIPGITVAENLFLGESSLFCNKLGIVNRRAMEQESRKALSVIHADHIQPDIPAAALDLQERKLVEVAKVMVKQPEILIVDETTTALSQKGRELLYELMNELKAQGKAVIFISHDLDEIKQVCDTLTRADNIPSRQNQVLLKAEHLTGSGLWDVSLELYAGEILGIGGLSECGMHMLGKALFGSARLTDGTVQTESRTYNSPRQATALGIGYVSKERDTESLCQQASIRDNIAIGGLKHIRKNKLIFKKRETAYVQQQIDTLSIKCRHMEQPVSAMSGGNKQKVVFGKWLGAGSRIMLTHLSTS